MQTSADYQQSVTQPETFWAREAERIHWQTVPTQILDATDPQRAQWFVDGTTNLCFNAVDRHLATRANQTALVHLCEPLSAESGPAESRYSYKALHREVSAMAAILLDLGVKQGDRVLLYLPVIPETVFAMLACVRIGAVHSVVFAGFPAEALAHRIDDVTPAVILTASDSRRNGLQTRLEPLLADAMALAVHRPAHIMCIGRDVTSIKTPDDSAADGGAIHATIAFKTEAQFAAATARGSKVHLYGPLRAAAYDRVVDCVWLASAAPSYILHTSGTTGKPKGIVRDTGGYAVALAASLDYQFGLHAGDVLFSTSDLGWVVGHSYGVYAPLIGGLTTVLYEGALTAPAPTLLWRVLQDQRVNALLSAPSAMRLVVRRLRVDPQRPSGTAVDLPLLRSIFLAGEPLDEVLSNALSTKLGKPVLDHYWQTETGSPVVADRLTAGADNTSVFEASHGQALNAVNGFNVMIADPDSASPCVSGQRGMLAISAPLPPGCLQGVWGDDVSGERLRQLYWAKFGPRHWYATADWGRVDETGGVCLLGRADDAINVAGQRIGTREIEAVLRGDPVVADVAVLGIDDALRGQVPVAFIVPVREALGEQTAISVLQARLSQRVVAALGASARPRRIFFVADFPRTRSGKIIRRAIATVFDGKRCDALQVIEDLQAFADAGEEARPISVD